jgi:hypothetical protein
VICLLGTARPALYGWTIGDDGGKGCRLVVVEGDGRVRLGDGKDVLEVICKGVGLVRTLAESLGGVADAGDKLWRKGDATRAGVSAFFGERRTGEGREKDVLPGAEPRFRGCWPLEIRPK